MDTVLITEYIKKAFEYKAESNYKKAVDFFYKALSLDNDSSEIMCEIALLYDKLKKPDRAVEYLERAIERKPEDKMLVFRLSQIYKNYGNYAKAEKLLKSLCLIDPGSFEFFNEYISSLLFQGKFHEILAEYALAGEKFKNSDLFYYMGLTHEKLGEIEEAENFYYLALAERRDNFDAGYRYAAILFENKKYEKAEEILLSIVHLQNNPHIYYLLGEINFLKNEYDEAIKYFSSACKSEYKNPVYFYELATAYSLKGFLNEAEYNYLEAIKFDPNNLSYNFSLAYLYYTNNQLSKAERVVAYILSINPQHPNAMTLKAKMLLDNNDIINAEKLVNEVIELSPSSDYAHFIKSCVYAKLGWWEKALEFVSRALDLKPDSFEYKLVYSKYLLETGKFSECIKIAELLLSVNKYYIDAINLKAEALIRIQNFKEAKRAVDSALKLDCNSQKSHFLNALIFMNTEKYNSAIDEFQTVLSYEPGNPRIFAYIAFCHYQNNDFNSAFQYYSEAANLDISNSKYKYWQAKSSARLGDVSDAIANFSVAKRLEPANYTYLSDYCNFLCSQSKHKQALQILKSSIKYLLNERDKNSALNLITEIEESMQFKKQGA